MMVVNKNINSKKNLKKNLENGKKLLTLEESSQALSNLLETAYIFTEEVKRICHEATVFGNVEEDVLVDETVVFCEGMFHALQLVVDYDKTIVEQNDFDKIKNTTIGMKE